MNEPHDPDVRDERLHDLLAVPPLDDVTRRRLVREALDRPVPKPSRVLAAASVAAALLVGAAVGVVLVSGPTPSDTTTAQRAPSAASDQVEALENAPAAGADAEAGPVTPLGALGDVSTHERLREAVNVGFERSVGPSEDTAVAFGYLCGGNAPATFGLVATSALGSATYDGVEVTVVVGTSPEGEALAVIVRGDTCAVIESVRLPKG